MKNNRQTKFKGRTVVFVILAIFSTFASSAQTWQWGKRGGAFTDGGNAFRETINDMATDKNGNVYAIGLIETLVTPNIDGHSLANYGNGKNILVVSFSCNGTYRWSKVIGGGQNSAFLPSSIGTDTLGHVYVSVINSNLPAPFAVHFGTDSVQGPTNFKNMTLIQYDTSGNFKWLRQPESDTQAIGAKSRTHCMHVEKNGNVNWLVLLQQGSVSGANWVAAYKPYILTYNASGTMINHVDIQMQTINAGFLSIGMNKTASGKFIFAGSQNLVQGSPISIGGNQVTHTMFLVAFSALGVKIWEKENTKSSYETRMWSKPQIDAQGNIYFSGDCKKNDVFNTFTFTNTLGMSTVPFIGKCDSNGTHKWINVANGRAADVQNSLSLINNNELWLSGSANSAYWTSSLFIQSPPNSGYPVYVARFNTSGAILSLDSLKGAAGGQNYANCNAVDNMGNLVVGGSFDLTLNVNSSTTLINSGGLSDLFIAKFGYPCNCTTQPNSNFTATITTGNTVRFNYSGTTANIDSLVWTWGDGQQQTVKTSLTTAITHTYTTVGSYNACANVYGKCGTSSFCKTTTVSVGVANLAALGAIKVYPNPANTYFTIEGAEGATALLTNGIGQKAMQFSVNAERQVMDISNLPAGMYLLQLTDAKGNRGVMSLVKE